MEICDGDRLEIGGASNRQRRQQVALHEGLRGAIAGDARDHGVSLGSGREALDVAAVGGVGDSDLDPVLSLTVPLRPA